MKVTSVNWQCVCIECIHYGRSEVSFDVLRLEGREGSMHFLGSLLFCHSVTKLGNNLNLTKDLKGCELPQLHCSTF
jgi:hypothetical protein